MELKTIKEIIEDSDIPRDRVYELLRKKKISDHQTNGKKLYDKKEIIKTLKENHLTAEKKFKINKSNNSSFNAIELFSGCGGLALGFKNAGITSDLLVEIDKDSCETLYSNFQNTEIINDDIANIDFRSYKNTVDIVAGGFPCQAFSYAGKSKGFEDTRGTLFFDFARAVKETNPKVAIGENVKGLISHDKGRTLSTMIRTLESLGYNVQYKLLLAQYFNVPQKRERVFIVATRKDLPNNYKYPEELDYFVPLGVALKDCPPSAGQEYPKRKKEIMDMVPQGGYWKDLPIEIQKEYMKGSFYLGGGKTGTARRLSLKEPSLTLVTSPAQGQTERCHPTETRPLTIRESARIQTFPDNWKFTGSLGSQYKQIGNAVPVNLAYYVGKSVIKYLKDI
ncbi:MAG: DNA (cytosine-5-)-methyltransferase [Flavobacteriaceae bacterium]|nr:DNA (cytosine-5-)-methyltransferase [Flavobacteriaceae bacterium]